jgi:hypothetical protein
VVLPNDWLRRIVAPIFISLGEDLVDLIGIAIHRLDVLRTMLCFGCDPRARFIRVGPVPHQDCLVRIDSTTASRTVLPVMRKGNLF